MWIEELTALEVRDTMHDGKTVALILKDGIEENGPCLATGKHDDVLVRHGRKHRAANWETSAHVLPGWTQRRTVPVTPGRFTRIPGITCEPSIRPYRQSLHSQCGRVRLGQARGAYRRR